MGTIQQRFEVEQPVAAVYEAISRPQEVLQRLPGVLRVTRVADELHRIMVGPPEAPREVDLQLTRNDALRRVEWRTTDGAWAGAVTAETIGPGRTAVGVHAESMAAEGESPPPSVVHDALQAFKRALQSQEIRISRPEADYGYAGSREPGASARRFASEWRDAARAAFARPTEYPLALARTLTNQMDRLWEQVWRGTPIARLPHMLPGLPWNPNVEVSERDDQVRVCLDVPGVDESHLQVEIENGYLTVRGERQDDRGTDGGRRRSELHYGSFTRRIPLPDGIDADAAKAVLRNGVLEIRIPLHRREARRVPVQHAS
jgi:HSP20 family protein